MDLYALGQTLYYCVTGHTIRGSGYMQMSQVVPELIRYDKLINILVRQVPQERFQTVEEIRTFLIQSDEESQKMIDHIKWIDKKHQELAVFDRIIRSSLPGSYGFVRAKNKQEINRVMNNLMKYYKDCELWWFRGIWDNPVYALQELSDGIWLIDKFECEISDLWVSRNPRDYHQFIILQLSPRLSFGLPGYEDKEDEVVGYYHGRYIYPDELSDGYALIDDQIVELDDTAELRRRNMRTDYLFLAPAASSFNNVANDRISEEIYQRLLIENKIEESAVRAIENFSYPRWLEDDPFR